MVRMIALQFKLRTPQLFLLDQSNYMEYSLQIFCVWYLISIEHINPDNNCYTIFDTMM